MGYHIIGVARLLTGQGINDEDGQPCIQPLTDGSRPSFGQQQIAGPHQLPYPLHEAEDTDILLPGSPRHLAT